MKEHVVHPATGDGEDARGARGSPPFDPAQIKDTLLEIIHSSLFASGLLEKYVHRAVEERLQSEIKEIVQREIQATLSSENVKVILEDKFRAISLYLKSEVVPKAVAQCLKGMKQPV